MHMPTSMSMSLILLALQACQPEPAHTNACDNAPQLPAATQKVRAGGEDFDIYSTGPATGEVVLLLQGFPDRTYEYRTLLPRLAANGYRSVAAVQSGAASTGPTQPDRAQQVLQIADVLQVQRFHLAGAQLAWDVAKRAPERVLSVATTSAAQVSAVAKLAEAAAACSGERP